MLVVWRKSPAFVHSKATAALSLNLQRNISDSTGDVSVKPLPKPSLSALRKGTGGRSSFNGIVCTVFGASGFIGRYLCNKLGKIGTQIILPYRGDDSDILPLRMVGDLGQVLFQPFSLKDEESIMKAMRYSNVVVNLIGRDWETINYKFDDVHCEGARTIARCAKQVGVEKLIHFSSLNAAEIPKGIVLKKGSKFLASKWKGEQAVREEFPEAIIMRPADVYGQEDRFLNYYATFWRRQFHWMPLWYKGERTIKQPVFVSDVAQGIVNAILERDTAGKTYECIGPKRYQLGELVDYFHRVMRRDGVEWGYRRYDMRWDLLFQLRITLIEKLCYSWPINTMIWEKVEREHTTDRTTGCPTLEDLGVTLTEIEDRVSWELKPYRAWNYYDAELDEFSPPQPPPVVTDA